MAIMNDFPPGTVPSGRIGQLREQVAAAADSGIDSIWVLQHYLGNMPTLQPLPLLGALSGDAGQMTLGTNMFILPLRHPVAVAEEFATLDHLTGGRLIAGFGMGYRDNELAAFGVPAEERKSRFEEALTVIKALWSGDVVHFSGRHFKVDNETISLAPVQVGGPPVWIGAGAHLAGARRAARLGDAWIIPPHVSPDRLGVVLDAYRTERRLAACPGTNELVVRRELLLHEDPAEARRLGTGARGRLSRSYAAYNPPDRTGVYRHLEGDRSAADVADESYLFTDPDGCIRALKELEAQGITYVILRMQWFDLPHEQVLHSLRLFSCDVLPFFRDGPP